jgi:2'-5' RNA ligase
MTAEKPLRTFFAAPVPTAAAARWEAATRAALGGGGSRWRIVPAESLHVTLRFLGETPPSLVPDLAEALSVAAAAVEDGKDPCAPATGEWLPLPQGRSPSVLAVRLSDPTGTLASVAASLEVAARRFGYPAERRPFLPHVTLARAVGAGAHGRERGAAAAGVTPSASFPVAEAFPLSEVVLFSSVPGPGGPRYVRLAAAPLTRRAPTRGSAPTHAGSATMQPETTANERR